MIVKGTVVADVSTSASVSLLQGNLWLHTVQLNISAAVFRYQSPKWLTYATDFHRLLGLKTRQSFILLRMLTITSQRIEVRTLSHDVNANKYAYHSLLKTCLLLFMAVNMNQMLYK